MYPEVSQLLDLVVDAITSWQVKVAGGLILIDIVLGIAAALRTGQFDLNKLAAFYKTMIIPYTLGYIVLYVVITYVIPAEQLGQIGEPINEAAVTVAWSALLLTLLKSILGNFNSLYKPEPE